MYETNDIVPLSHSNAIAVATKKNTLQQCSYTDKNGDACKGEFCELSVYSSRPALHPEVVSECAALLAAFPEQRPAFFSILHKAIEDEGMSVERLHESVKKLIAGHKYRTFNVADIIGYDKTIQVARNVSTLRHITRNPRLDYEDIVVVRGRVDGNECKMYGVKYDVENSPYKSRIIGTWNSDSHSWNILGQVNDATIPQRQQAFKQSLFVFCNCPPRYNGRYDAELVSKFYDHYSQIVGFGDRLRFEQYQSWDTESELERWCNTGAENKQSLNGKSEDVEEVTDEDALRNRLTLQVITENMGIYQRMSPQAAERKMQELIDKKLKENGLQTK